MLLFLYGEDTFRSRQKLNQIKDRARKSDPQNLNMTQFEGEEAEFEKIKKAVMAAPFLVRYRLVILENILFSGKKELKDKLAKFLKENKVPKTTNLVFWEGGMPNEKEALFKILLEKADQAENFKLLSYYEVIRWISREVKKEGGTITQEAASLLASLVGNNLWQAFSEIRKLVLYKKNSKFWVIVPEDVERLVSASFEANIFNFIDAIVTKNRKEALKLLHNQIIKGEEEIYLLSMIAYQFRNMILISELTQKGKSQAQISSEAKIHPYVVKKLQKVAQNFDLERLKEIYKKLLQMDWNLKRTTNNSLLSFDILVYELCE